MRKKLLSLLFICLLLTAPVAVALDFDPSAYTKEELEYMFGLIAQALYGGEEATEETDPNAAYEDKGNLLYEDDYVALRYIRFWTKLENGPCATIALRLLNKFDDALELAVTEAHIDGISMVPTRIHFSDPSKFEKEAISAYSSQFYFYIDLPEEDLMANGIERAQTLALTFSYRNETAGLFREITTDTMTDLKNGKSLSLESAMPPRMEKVSSAIEGMPGLLHENEHILLYYDNLTIENGEALLRCRLLNKYVRDLDVRLRDVLLNGQLLSVKELEILPFPKPEKRANNLIPTSFAPLLIHLSEDELKEYGIEEAETLALRFSYSDIWDNAQATISTGSVSLR